jgi:thiol:disulfide interchange protein DsbD
MASPPISVGSPTKPPRSERRRGGRVKRALALIAWLAAPFPVAAKAQADLLLPERAFAFSVQALDDKSVEARFAVADGYYLYREKLKFSVEPTTILAVPAFPPGQAKEDPFFGKVETYRGSVVVRISLDKPEPGQRLVVRAQSQGCADAGVCYPPQIQSITLALPAAGARPGPPVQATPSRKAWFN